MKKSYNGKGEILPRLKYVFNLCRIVQVLAGALSVLPHFRIMAGVLCINFYMLWAKYEWPKNTLNSFLLGASWQKKEHVSLGFFHYFLEKSF